MDFSETIEVKVFDKEEHFSIDSYFFAMMLHENIFATSEGSTQ